MGHHERDTGQEPLGVRPNTTESVKEANENNSKDNGKDDSSDLHAQKPTISPIDGAIWGFFLGAVVFFIVGALVLGWGIETNAVVMVIVGAAIGAIVGTTVGLKKRDWLFLKFLDGASGGSDGCVFVFAALAIVVLAVAEVIWVLGQWAVGQVVRAPKPKKAPETVSRHNGDNGMLVWDPSTGFTRKESREPGDRNGPDKSDEPG